MIEDLFAFPIIMVDGDAEDKKDILGLPNDSDIDIITGEAECPYYDFVSVCDRWLPTEDSLDKAMNKEFEACGVTFMQSGSFIVPWPKAKFKKELAKFISKLPKKEPKVKFVTKEDLLEMFKDEEK